MKAGKTLWQSALLLAGVAGVASFVACGAKESNPSSGGASTAGSAPSGGTTVPAGATFDSNDPTEVAAALKKYMDVDTPRSPEVAHERDRGSVDGLAFPTWPVGEVRKGGLRTYRIDVSPAFEGKAMLRFLDGKKVLFEAPFDPATVTTVGQIPATVYEGLKVGDSVKWGVFFEDKKKSPITADFKIVDKASATKRLARADSDRNVSPLLRDLARAQTMIDNELLTEAVQVYAELAAEDNTLVLPYRPMADCLQRLHLQKTPLYRDALARSANSVASRRVPAGRGPGDSDIPPRGGFGGKGAPVGPQPKPVPTPIPAPDPTPTPTPDVADAVVRVQTALENQSRTAFEHAARRADAAKQLHVRADAGASRAVEARGEADAAAKHLKALRDQLAGADAPQLPPEQRAALTKEIAQGETSAQGAEDAAKRAQAIAEELARHAAQGDQVTNYAQLRARELAKQAQEAKALGGGAGAPGMDGDHPNPTTVPQQVALLDKQIRDTAGSIASAQESLTGASKALQAAQRQADSGPPEGAEHDQAQADLQLARQAHDDAQAAVDAANAARDALKAAREALKNP